MTAPTNEDGTAAKRRPWVEVPPPPVVQAFGGRTYRCGELLVVVAHEPQGWHLSCSAGNRYPTWDELRDARYDLLPGHMDMGMILPPLDEYVNTHGHTLHLHEVPR